MPWIACRPGLPPASTGDRAGSTATMRTSGSSCFSTSPTPVIVPPVPTPATNASSRPLGVAQDLQRGRAAVHLRVGRVVELLRHEVVVFFSHHLLGREDGAGHALDRRRQDELRAVALEQLRRSTLMSSGIVRISL